MIKHEILFTYFGPQPIGHVDNTGEDTRTAGPREVDLYRARVFR